jgi:hypothetical protein
LEALVRYLFRLRIAWVAGLLFGALTLTPGLVVATTINALDLPDLVKKADLIFDGTVTGIQSYLSSPAGDSAIHTRVTLILNGPPIKGQASSPLALNFLGGTLGTQHMVVKGIPRLVVGQRLILFCHSPDEPYVSPIIGFDQGVLRVVHDTQTGNDLVYRWWGQPVHGSQPFTSRLPPEAGSSAARPAATETVDQFIQQIKQLLTNG